MDFPCLFPIKIVFQNVPGVEENLLAVLRRHYPDINEETLKRNLSKNGSYIAMTIEIYALDQVSLDQLYLELTQQPHVNMVL